MIEDDPVTFTHEGTEYRGTIGGINRRRPLEVGGFQEEPEIVLAVNVKNSQGGNLFGQDRPKVGDRITIGVKTYRIDRTELDSFEESLQMDLRSEHK